jgi:hypothetical protein
MKRQVVGRMAVSLLAVSVVCLSHVASASASGGNAAVAKICQKGGWESLLTPSGGFTGEDACVSDGAQGGGALGVSASVANGDVTFTVSGFGLLPGSVWAPVLGNPAESLSLSVPANGIVSIVFGPVACGTGQSASASATISTGVTITTPTVNSPCG